MVFRSNRVDTAAAEKNSGSVGEKKSEPDPAVKQPTVNCCSRLCSKLKVDYCTKMCSKTKAFLNRIRHRYNLAKATQVLGICYLVIGLLLSIFTLLFLPSNPLSINKRICWGGACYVYNVSSWPKLPFHHHALSPSDFHPYNFTTLFVGILLISYAVLLLTRPTLHVVNLGHIFNWAVAYLCTGAALQTLEHFNTPISSILYDPVWMEGLVHTFVEPVCLFTASILLILQALTNLLTLEVRLSPTYYSSLYKECGRTTDKKRLSREQKSQYIQGLLRDRADV